VQKETYFHVVHVPL